MFGRTNILRCLSLLMLTGLLGLIINDLSNAAEKDSKPTPGVTAKTTGTKLDQPALSRLIDREVTARLEAEKVTPSDRSDDAEFLRRAYVDIVGHIPTAEQAASLTDKGFEVPLPKPNAKKRKKPSRKHWKSTRRLPKKRMQGAKILPADESGQTSFIAVPSRA